MIYRNPKLLKLAKEAPYCFACRSPNTGTVVAAHANMQSMGKGMGLKAADIVAFICHSCHAEIDGTKPGADRAKAQAEWALAAVHSMRWALENHPEVFQ